MWGRRRRKMRMRERKRTKRVEEVVMKRQTLVDTTGVVARNTVQEQGREWWPDTRDEPELIHPELVGIHD